MVEWKKLVAVADVLYGYPFESSLFSEDSTYIPLIRIRDVKPAKASTYYSGGYNEAYRIKKGDILVGMDGEFNLGKWDDKDGLLNQRVLKLTGKEGYSIDGYLFHYMGPVFKKIERETAGGSVKHLSAKVINSILIPIPSLEEQTRIVGILDTFTSAIDNLKEQITQRRKQYGYYREQLLDLEGKPGVEIIELGELGSFFGGLSGKTKEDFVDGNAKFITYMNVFANPSLDVKTTGVVKINEGERQNKIQKGDILFTGSSETPDEAGMSCVVTDELRVDYYLNSFCFGIRLDTPEQYNLHFLKHILRSRLVRKKIAQSASGVTRFNISKKRFAKITILLPPLQEQQRIVSILDTFEDSIQNLEAQLDQRQKQYEYYRNELLTFE
jgi:type I restriction enzyme S subunit